MSEVYTFGIKSGQPTALINITNEVQNVIKDSGIKAGICVIFAPHTSAGITLNENTDQDVIRDFVMETNKIVPISDGYHHIEGNSAAHIKSSIVGVSQTLIIDDGRLLLGTWQGIYFADFDGPRIRKVYVKIIEG
ncbi:MAG: hypothetical protein K0S01_587 [Herbinix sp.]|jgi:secondary thiamine-phosphate synthase enzyme|nr:hypothetical protein [Herbinix sp.]